MAISQRNNSWQVSVSFRGQRVRRSFKNHDDARRFEAESLAVLISGKGEEASESVISPDGTPTTFGGLADRVWKLEWSSQKAANHTRGRLKDVRSYFGEGTQVTEITPYLLESYIFHLQSLGNGPATINRKLAIVSKIMNYAHRHGIIKTKPTAPLQREPRGRIRYYSDEEEAAIIAASEGCLRDFFVTLIDTGMRKGEALSFEWKDVNWESQEITLADPDKIKASLPRTIPMTRRVCGLLEKRRELIAAKPFDYTGNQMDHMVRDFKRDSGYEGNTEALFHTCRHTFCSRLLQRGVPITTVKELAGHRDIKTTLRYAHLAPSNYRSAISQLETDAR